MLSNKITIEKFIVFLVFIGFVSGTLLGASIGMYYKSNEIINTIQGNEIFRINNDVYLVEKGDHITDNLFYYKLQLYNCNDINYFDNTIEQKGDYKP